MGTNFWINGIKIQWNATLHDNSALLCSAGSCQPNVKLRSIYPEETNNGWD